LLYNHIFATGTKVTRRTTQLSDDLTPKAEARYDFTAGSDQEISFKVGYWVYIHVWGVHRSSHL